MLTAHTIDLLSPDFPLLSEYHGQTVLISGNNNLPNDKERPQVYYAHNVLPTTEGYQSIGYEQLLPRTIYTDITTTVTVYESAFSRVANLIFSASGKLHVAYLDSTEWLEIAAPADIQGRLITKALVRGVTYIYFSGLGCYRYDFGSNSLVAVTLTALSTSSILGIVGNSGYLLAYGNDGSVAWSSTVDTTDFTPSLITGAGSGRLDGALGKTIVAVSVANGIIFFNEKNAVACLYQDNIKYPFSFTPIPGSGGLVSADNTITNALDSQAAYAYTTSGLQAVTVSGAQPILPRVSDFLAGKALETFNEDTNALESITPVATLKKKLAWIADRYLIISYGDGLLSHAIVFDIYLGRLGKLKVDHVDIFEFNLYLNTIYDAPRKSIGVIKRDGTLSVVNPDTAYAASSGVLILGKYQLTKERFSNLLSVLVENIPAAATFNIYDLPTYDGKSFYGSPLAGHDSGQLGVAKKYYFSSVAKAHTLLCKGRFNLVSGQINLEIAGDQ